VHGQGHHSLAGDWLFWREWREKAPRERADVDGALGSRAASSRPGLMGHCGPLIIIIIIIWPPDSALSSSWRPVQQVCALCTVHCVHSLVRWPPRRLQTAGCRLQLGPSGHCALSAHCPMHAPHTVCGPPRTLTASLGRPARLLAAPPPPVRPGRPHAHTRHTQREQNTEHKTEENTPTRLTCGSPAAARPRLRAPVSLPRRRPLPLARCPPLVVLCCVQQACAAAGTAPGRPELRATQRRPAPSAWPPPGRRSPGSPAASLRPSRAAPARSSWSTLRITGPANEPPGTQEHAGPTLRPLGGEWTCHARRPAPPEDSL